MGTNTNGEELRDPLIASLFERAAPIRANEAFIANACEALDRQAQRIRRRRWFVAMAVALFCVVLALDPALRGMALSLALLPTTSLVDVEGVVADGGAATALRWIVQLLAPMNSAAGVLALACFFLRRSLLQLWVR